MKLIKLLLIMSTFLIMVASVFNLLHSSGDKTGVYIELVVMFLLTLTMVLLNSLEKKMKNLEQDK